MRSSAALSAVIFLVLSLSILNPNRLDAIESAYASEVPAYSVVKILCPLNQTYDSRPPMLRVTFPYSGLDYTLTYDVDGKSEGAIPWTIDNPSEYHLIHGATGRATLPELSNGSHRINVTLIAKVTAANGNPPSAPFKPTSPGSSNYEARFAGTVYFTVGSPPLPILPYATYHPGDTYTTVYIRNISAPPSGTKPPIVTILSPANRSTITTNNITLAFDLTAVASTGFNPDSFVAHYTTSWEPNHNISIASEFSSASITLTGIPNGQQWIKVYATALSSEDETGRENITKPNTPGSIIIGNFLYVYSKAIGKEGSSSANFAIDATVDEELDGLPQPDAGSSPNELAFVAGILVIASFVAAGMLLYRRKRKLRAETATVNQA